MFSTNRISYAILPWLLSAAMAIVLVFPALAEGAPEVAISPRLQQLTEKVQAGDSKAQDVFWAAVTKEGLPMLETGAEEGLVTMTFLLRAGNGADPRNVRVAMMVPEHPLYAFSPVVGTNLWSATLEVSDEAMGMYWLAWPRGKDGNSEAVFDYPHRDGIHYEFFADPNAGHSIRGTIQPQFPDKKMSVFFASPDQRLPYSKAQADIPKGTLEHKTLESAAFGGPRQVSVYLPNGYSEGCRYPWVLVFDAENYLSLMSTTIVLDNMIAEKIVPPMGAVFIHTGASRVPDLAPNPRMEGFVRDELIPWARKTYALSVDNQQTAVMGFSHGGLAALNAGLKNSDLIGAVIAHSSSAWWSSTLRPPFSLLESMPPEANELARSFTAGQKLPLRFYMDVGAWEGNWQVNSNIQLKDALVKKGYSVSFRTYEGGHDYLAWRETMPGALRNIFSGRTEAAACVSSQQ
ncbi:alpha/beta hydrolase [Kordiimonas pumila]|uniref:Alpha/beta hydrolase n=1 Tax=Kordiimonas pumila TaxID=2161677 RepID=A0ABV7D4J6_9PROT|nr:alpha/beta hydrolase-fold protein [Kordiimonas pumila]